MFALGIPKNSGNTNSHFVAQRMETHKIFNHIHDNRIT